MKKSKLIKAAGRATKSSIENAASSLDATFGPGFAISHPEMVMELVKIQTSNLNSLTTLAAYTELAESLMECIWDLTHHKGAADDDEDDEWCGEDEDDEDWDANTSEDWDERKKSRKTPAVDLSELPGPFRAKK